MLFQERKLFEWRYVYDQTLLFFLDKYHQVLKMDKTVQKANIVHANEHVNNPLPSLTQFTPQKRDAYLFVLCFFLFWDDSEKRNYHQPGWFLPLHSTQILRQKVEYSIITAIVKIYAK